MLKKTIPNYKEKYIVPGSKIDLTFSEKVIDRVFTPLRLGQLSIKWPDGTQKIYGQEPEGIAAEIRVRRHDFFKKCLLYGDVGFGEAYVDGDWDTPHKRGIF